MKNIKRRDFIKTTGMGAAALLCAAPAGMSCGRESGRKPNIVYILADDLGYGDVSCLNPQGKIHTPNIDRLASEGMIFTDAHSGSAVCTPTRYGILTGRYAWRSRLKEGVLWGYSPPLIDTGRMTVASMLKKQGYATACVGKWHLGLDYTLTDGRRISQKEKQEKVTVDYSKPIKGGPADLGFDYFFGIPASLDMDPYFYVENDRAVAAPVHQTEGREGYAFFREGPLAPGFDHEQVLSECTSRAVKFIDKQVKSNPGKPLFLYFPLTAPHTPILPTDKFKGKSGLGPYGDFVLQVDWTVGRIMQALERNGLNQNTLFIFTSDNGCSPMANFKALAEHDHNPSYHFRGYKADIFEGGHRIPFIARWPGKIAAGSSCADTICLTDLLATAADICAVDLPDSAAEDSYSILPDLLGTANGPIREATVHHSVNGSFSIRQGKWKLELCPGSGGWSDPVPEKALALGLPMAQLYDLSRDISEQKNLQDQYPEVVHRLTSLLEKYVAQGRSTPGRPQQNEGDPDIWKPLRGRGEKHTPTRVDHLAVGKKIMLTNGMDAKFADKGSAALLDGLRGTSWFKDGYWAGIEGQDLEALVDLGRPLDVEKISTGFLQDQNSWIFFPDWVETSISLDGQNWLATKREETGPPVASDQKSIRDFSFKFDKQPIRFIKVVAGNIRACPQWHPGAGGKAWLFADEIVVQ